MQMSAEGGEHTSCEMGTATLCASAVQKGAPPKLYISGFFVLRRERAAEEESAHSAPVPLSSSLNSIASLSAFIGLGGFVFFPLPPPGAFGVKLCRNSERQ